MRVLRLLLIALIVGVAVTACGGAATPTATPEPPTATPESPTPTSAPTDTPAPTATASPPTATPLPPTPTPEPSGVVNAEPSLNLRSTASTDGELLGTIPTGRTIAIIGRSGDSEWLRVRSTDFGDGWVKSEFVDLKQAIDSLPEVPPSGAAATPETATSAPPASSTGAPPAATTPAPVVPTEPAQPSAPTPASGEEIDKYLDALLAGRHNRLGNVESRGAAPAGGKVELVIANDSPFSLKVNLGSPARTETNLDSCKDCKVYEADTMGTCSPEKPQKTLRIDPGALRMAIEPSSPDLPPYLGQWTLEGDQKYLLCFAVVRTPSQ